MAELFIKKHSIDTEISGYHLRSSPNYTIYVGYKCDPKVVQEVVLRYAGLSFSNIIFETALPDNKETYNNLYILSRLD